MTKKDLKPIHLVAIRKFCFDSPITQFEFGEKINFTQAHLSRVETGLVPISNKLAAIIEKSCYLGKLSLLLKRQPRLLEDL